MNEVSYSAAPQLLAPGAFLAASWRDLRVAPAVAWLLFVRQMQAGYRRHLLGYLWVAIPPIATALVWVALHRARVLQVGRTDLPYPLFVLTGITLWQLFLDALNAPLQRLSSSRPILTRSRIPHEAFLLAGGLDVMFSFAVRTLILVPVFAWFSVPPTRALLLAPMGVAALLALGFGIGLSLAPLGLLYPDVARGITVASGMLFFLTPVLYPLPTAGPASALGLLNPVAPLLTTTRQWLTGGSPHPAQGAALVAAAAVVLLAAAWLSYRLASAHLVARL
jgi:lipopolysaccharide transport system permease protein